MSPSRLLPALSAAALCLTLTSSASADIRVDPVQVETCTARRHSNARTVCNECRVTHRDFEVCQRKYAGTAWEKVCKSRGASVYNEVWCRAKDADPSTNSPLPVATPEQPDAGAAPEPVEAQPPADPPAGDEAVAPEQADAGATPAEAKPAEAPTEQPAEEKPAEMAAEAPATPPQPPTPAAEPPKASGCAVTPGQPGSLGAGLLLLALGLLIARRRC